ncbi:MAG: glucose-1-phosphate thymidylyltransferase, partial [Symbiobacteriaceae bacterium]|nr:glucose-1-phosphate thymidylyltransferase [Symbiobacteriaceae bacterium]
EPLAHLFHGCEQVWDVLKKLPLEVTLLTSSPQILGEVHPTAVLAGAVSVGAGAVIGPHVYIQGPVYIGKGAEIRQGAFVREYSIIGDNCILGHNSEVKGAIMLQGSQAPHFAYIGDSILGRGVNLGAGTKLANFKLQGDEIVIRHLGESYPTGLRKLGAIIGDGSSVGCNAVTAPGTLIGKNCWIYSLISLRGVIPASSIVKPSQGFEIVPIT